MHIWFCWLTSRPSLSRAGNMKAHPISGDVAAVAASQDDDSSLEASDVQEARDDLRDFEKNHQNDPNLPAEKLAAVHDALAHNDSKEMADTDALLEEDSPYDEVRAAVRNTDGGEYANTVRAWILGLIFVTIGAGLNMFLSMRYVEDNRR